MERVTLSHNCKTQGSSDWGEPVPSEGVGSTTPTLKAQGILKKKVKKDSKTQNPKKLQSLLREKKAGCGNTKGWGGEVGTGRSGGQHRSTAFYD